ncbi:hypothetical protein ATANTOWER_004181 [Ataeniobius toweri]|uniref:Solute carrier organic anion transporter family member n=1 Tax=Ataeniobius toweri TaxID=208326 RepID=A0ABU7AX03_9TELE|nr:hypothetical protein [Ataeniobius toweri]
MNRTCGPSPDKLQRIYYLYWCRKCSGSYIKERDAGREPGSHPGARPGVGTPGQAPGGRIAPRETRQGQARTRDTRSSYSGPITCRGNHEGQVQRGSGNGRRWRPRRYDLGIIKLALASLPPTAPPGGAGGGVLGEGSIAFLPLRSGSDEAEDDEYEYIYSSSYIWLPIFIEDEIELDHKDLRWVGAWWLGFLVASSLLFLTALPYLFFPREMSKENGADDMESRSDCKPQQQQDPIRELSLVQFLKSFPRIALRTLRSPIYLLVVLGQVNLAALLSGLATFMAKFIEKQFSQTISFSNMMIGGVGIPLAVLGIVLGGALMRRFNVSVSGASKLCSGVILLCMFSALPMLFMGCSTKTVAGIYPERSSFLSCSSDCPCPAAAFNPICGSNGVEFRSPCHAGCLSRQTDGNNKIMNFTDCRCINNGSGTARPGTCGSGCSHLLLPFMALLALTSFITSFSQTPSYMMILRTVPAEDKSFAVGVQYMLFRVLAFMPGPVLYGSVIDTTCIMWGEKCGQKTSCQYYDLDSFRHRFLGLMVVFVCGALLCFLLTMVVLRRGAGSYELPPGSKGGYELVGEQKAPEKEQNQVKT